jgi:hypothetical protein
VSLLIVPASAVLLEFDNCLSESYKNGNPKQLQFVPYWLDAVFNTTDPSHNLQVTVWGDVTGFVGQNQSAPPLNLSLNNPDSKYWNPANDSTVYGGKIINIPNAGATDPNLVKFTTLSNKVNVLTYEPYDHSEQFCANLVNFSCPLGPAVLAEPYVEPLYCILGRNVLTFHSEAIDLPIPHSTSHTTSTEPTLSQLSLQLS